MGKTRVPRLSCGGDFVSIGCAVLTQNQHVTDRQTDRQTDRRTDRQTDGIPIAVTRSAVHTAERVKNDLCI